MFHARCAVAAALLLGSLPGCCEKRSCGPSDADAAIHELGGDDAVNCGSLRTVDERRECVADAKAHSTGFFITETKTNEVRETTYVGSPDGRSYVVEFYMEGQYSHVLSYDCLREGIDGFGEPACLDWNIRERTQMCVSEDCSLTLG